MSVWSASRLATYQDCALRGKFIYADELPSEQSGAASYGTIMHYVVEQIDRGMPHEEAKNLFLQLWREPERLGVKPDYFPFRTSYDSYKRKGLLTIDGYREMRQWGKPKIIAHEYPFMIPFGDHHIRGHIDRLELRTVGRGKNAGEVLCVTDLKTAAKRPTKFDLRTNIQWTIYMLATQIKEFWTGIEGSPMHLGFENGEQLFHHFKDHRRVGVYLMLGESCTELDVGERGDMDFQQLYRLITEVERAIEHDIYIPRISADTCGQCDFFDVCGIDIPKPPLDVRIDEPARAV